MQTNKRTLIVAVILGLITVIALNSYIRSLDMPAMASIPHTEVVVAINTIPAHTRITNEMLQTESIPSDAVHPEALLSIGDAAGGISRVDIIKGEQVLASRIATEDRRASLSYRVPEGLRAISIPVNEVVGVAGYISPGDKVDVLVSYIIDDILIEEEEQDEMTLTFTVFQNILVLASGEETRDKDDEESQVVSTVTLAVKPEQAEVLAFATQMGYFHLTLRSPLDETEVNLDFYGPPNFDTFRER